MLILYYNNDVMFLINAQLLLGQAGPCFGTEVSGQLCWAGGLLLVCRPGCVQEGGELAEPGAAWGCPEGCGRQCHAWTGGRMELGERGADTRRTVHCSQNTASGWLCHHGNRARCGSFHRSPVSRNQRRPQPPKPTVCSQHNSHPCWCCPPLPPVPLLPQPGGTLHQRPPSDVPDLDLLPSPEGRRQKGYMAGAPVINSSDSLQALSFSDRPPPRSATTVEAATCVCESTAETVPQGGENSHCFECMKWCGTANH